VTPELLAARGIKMDMEYLASVRADWIRRYTEIFSV
jgi:hypothetical protein